MVNPLGYLEVGFAAGIDQCKDKPAEWEQGTRHSEEQIITILKQDEAGLTTADLCRQHGITEQTYYRFSSSSCFSRFASLLSIPPYFAFHRKLKHVVAELTLDNRALKDVLSKNW